MLGDQLDHDASAFDGFDSARDAVWMAEVAEESEYAWSSKQRIAVFLSAMRHFAWELRERRVPLHYVTLEAADNRGSLGAELDAAIRRLRPQDLVMTAPGDWRVLQALREVAKAHRLALELRDDRHFFSTVREFAAHARTHKPLRMEYWYRQLRTRTGILMEGGEPTGGRWNFDVDNRQPFGAGGPRSLPPRLRAAPDALTAEVVAMVEERFPQHPGSLESFDWPVTRAQALRALEDFILHCLPHFGRHQDAMWSGEPWLYHSLLSSALNLKLINPREAVHAAELAYHEGRAPLASVEGFVRQILGWREYVRGVYWTQMPDYASRNALDAQVPLPGFFWTGDTDMACLRDALRQTLRHGYAHHIQRLMVTGLYAMQLGVRPHEIHLWYLGVYVDAVEWVEMPNTLGMSQYADGGLMGSKPYAASGRYIQRMSNYCKGCRYDPARSVGEEACPFTTLY
ncbi:MAG TPA: cryptochrome/photolyase family protein [Pseudoxanthomonas sp.]|nr:cryptochrome/photolyase family protein [Pseudoxanthomonas sp.]